MSKKWEEWLDQGVVLLFLIALIGYMPTARPSDRMVWIGALALLLLRTVWLAARREVYFCMDVNLFLYVLLFVWGLLSCFWSKDIREFRTYTMVSFPVVLCAVFCLSAYIGQRIEPERFLYLLIAAGVAAGLRYCLYTDWSGLAAGTYLRGDFGRRMDDVTNYNTYTMIISISCVTALYCAIVQHRRAAIFPALVLFVIILLGGSRKNIVAIPLVALLFSLFVGNGAKKAKILLVLLAVLAGGVYLLQTVPALSNIRSSLEGMFNGLTGSEEAQVDDSTEQRMYLMQRAIEVWAEHPVLGVGWHNYRYYNDARLYAHNNYAELLASLGSVGFLLYYAMFIRVGYILCSGFMHRRVFKEDILLLGFSVNNLVIEFGSISLYFKERMILMLLIFYWHSCATRRKTYLFALQ